MRTYKHKHSCTLRTPLRLYMYTYRGHAQARGSTHNRCIAQAVHVKQCTRTCTVCPPKHADFRTLGASLKPPMPNTLHVHVEGVRQARALTSNRSTAKLRTLTRAMYTRQVCGSDSTRRALCKYMHMHLCTTSTPLAP